MKKDTANRTFAGLNSKKVNVSFKDRKDTFSIFYTEDIKLSHPNQTNPYHKISGVLTAFRLTMGPYLMQFNATKFNPVLNSNEGMIIPEDAIEVDREEMIAILDRLMEQNK